MPLQGERRHPSRLVLGAVLAAAALNVVLTISEGQQYESLWAVLNRPGLPYGHKMMARWSPFYQYLEFVKANTPETAVIAHPPWTEPWPQTGHLSLCYYFLHPRHLVRGTREGIPWDKRPTHVLVAWGDNPRSADEAYGWPKALPQGKVLYAPRVQWVPWARENMYGIIELPSAGQDRTLD